MLKIRVGTKTVPTLRTTKLAGWLRIFTTKNEPISIVEQPLPTVSAYVKHFFIFDSKGDGKG
ncbi:hypothetical protein DDY07_18375 [Methylomonas sp. ZR1]|nr:hypothetical protein [Methylomonas sp. ZR1]